MRPLIDCVHTLGRLRYGYAVKLRGGTGEAERMKHVGAVRVACAAVSAMAVFALSASVGSAAVHAGMVKLSGTASPTAAGTPSAGAVPANSPLEFTVNLKLPNDGAAEAFARAVSTPGNALYGKYLTPAQWEQRFSPTQSQVDAVVAFLRQSGFTVLGVTPDRMAVQVSGTAGQVARVFSTSLSYHLILGKTLRVASKDLSVPASLAGIVGAVSGVNQTIARPNLTSGNVTSSAPATNSPVPPPPGFRVARPCSAYYGEKTDAGFLPPFDSYPYPAPWAVCGYTPQQLRGAYSMPSSGPDGSGVTVAIVDAYTASTLFADAHEFAALNDPSHPLEPSQFSELTASSYNFLDDCAAPSWLGEQTLDVEAVHTMAPGAHILYAGARNCMDSLFDMDLYIIDHHLASVITNSWGDPGGDLLDPDAFQDQINQIYLMAAGTGVSMLYSSGDFGDNYILLRAPIPDFPADNPLVTAVGGTSLQVGAANQRIGEFGWSTGRSLFCSDTLLDRGGCTKAQKGTWLPATFQSGSGGGTSYHYPQPFYQQGVVPSRFSEQYGTSPKRVEPDISLVGDPSTGMEVGETQTFPNGVYYDQYRIGGTSVASPLLAGVVARADQAAGHSLGLLNPKLYSFYGNSSALYDILPAGKQDMARADYVNTVDASKGYLYSTRVIDWEGTEVFCEHANECYSQDVTLHTAPGYDNMTGLGSPGNAFLNALTAP